MKRMGEIQRPAAAHPPAASAVEVHDQRPSLLRSVSFGLVDEITQVHCVADGTVDPFERAMGPVGSRRSKGAENGEWRYQAHATT